MAVLLDTTRVAQSDRAEAIDAAMRYATVPNRVTLEDPPSDVHSRIDLWDFGPASLLRQGGSGMRISRTAKELQLAAPERISLSLLSSGRWEYTQHGITRTVISDRPELVLTDLTARLDYNRSGEGGSRSFLVDIDQLGLTVDVIRKAAPRIRSSPLYDLVLGHIGQLDDLADRSTGPVRTMVGTATVELVRALITSAAQDIPRQREAMDSSLPTRIAMYLRQHLYDPDLSPAQVARAHNISVRHLYNLWAERDVSLAQWVIQERLEAARRELARPDPQSRTIASIARQCGFTDAAHFSRRFREAYGMSPRDWRELRASDVQP